jgi:transcription antitermination factor NusG
MPVPYWCAARMQPHREALALHFLGLAGYEVYCPRLRALRVSHGRKIETRPLLFPGYTFVLIERGWYAASKSPGLIGLVMADPTTPAKLSDAVIAGIRSREIGGLVDLPPPPEPKVGKPLRVVSGPLAGRQVLYAGMRPKERIEVLMVMLGSIQRVALPVASLEF